VGAADRDGHATHANGERIAPERAEVEGLHGDTFVEPEVAEAGGLAGIEGIPVDREDARSGAERKRVETRGLGNEGRVHLQLIINNKKERKGRGFSRRVPFAFARRCQRGG
jgi:hypothetical protein